MERAGKWDDADEAFAVVFQEAIRSYDLEGAVDALHGRFRSLRQLRRYEEAVELAELSRVVAESNGLHRAAARSVNMIALIRYFQSDWRGAEALYKEALERALDIGDDELVGWTCQNLGIVANILGNLREARIRYLESIGSTVRSEMQANTAMTYNNLGIVCSDLEEWMEADLYFTRGIEIAERFGDSPLLAKLFVNRTKPLIRVGELDQARDSLTRAEALARETDDAVVLSEAARYRGVLLGLEGDPAGARVQLGHALAIASRSELALERAEALCELAQLDRSEGRTGAAVAALREAREIYLSLGAERDVARVTEGLKECGLLRELAPAGIPLDGR